MCFGILSALSSSMQTVIPCPLCADVTHNFRCPNELCFKCGKSGHQSKVPPFPSLSLHLHTSSFVPPYQLPSPLLSHTRCGCPPTDVPCSPFSDRHVPPAVRSLQLLPLLDMHGAVPRPSRKGPRVFVTHRPGTLSLIFPSPLPQNCKAKADLQLVTCISCNKIGHAVCALVCLACALLSLVCACFRAHMQWCGVVAVSSRVEYCAVCDGVHTSEVRACTREYTLMSFHPSRCPSPCADVCDWEAVQGAKHHVI